MFSIEEMDKFINKLCKVELSERMGVGVTVKQIPHSSEVCLA